MEYASPAMRIGKHEWRMVVVPIGRYPETQSEYQFRRPGESDWRPSTEWPGYDADDGAYAGLPKSLVRLYRKHHADATATTRGETALLPLS